MQIRKVRDLTLIDLGQEKTVVIACDSCGGVGLKEYDVLKVSPFVTGKYTARVAILEILCSGADVVCLANTICNEMEVTGKKIIQGIEEELEEAGIGKIVLTGSTEENFATFATGFGVTAVGLVENKKLKVNNIKDEALLIVIGQPKVGEELLKSKKGDIANYSSIKMLLEFEKVYELVPVGSKGILYEVQQLAQNNNMQFILNHNIQIDINKSSGPSTVVVAAMEESFFQHIDIPGSVEVIGRLRKN
jgi:selenophosphate synthetase-related protein